MGGDDDKIYFDKATEIRRAYREKIDVKDSDFLIVTGGKIDSLKNIHLLMQAVSEMSDTKLVVFGNAAPEMSETINELSQNPNIRYIGWVDSDDAYNWFLSSDLAVFPGTHSVLWEQAIACGIPCVFKHWEGMEHVDVGGNCKFLYNDSVVEIKEALAGINSNRDVYNQMKQIAVEKGIPTFSYREIAKRSINI